MPRRRPPEPIFPVSPDDPFGIGIEPVEVERFVARDATRAAPTSSSERLPMKPYWSAPKAGVWLYQADCLSFMDRVAERYPNGCFDMIFADPPYFLSNGGISCHAGKMVSVNKGDWDKSRGPEANHEFNLEWLRRSQRLLKPNGTIWVSGTAHVIHSVGYAMQQLGFKLLNDITWIKPNPPPNLSCRYFTHATETIIWAAKNAKSKHFFNYDLMRKLAGGRQMKSLWTDLQRDAGGPPNVLEVLPPAREEKAHGKHPTQKPVLLLERIILASTAKDALVLDPFMGSGTTGVAACKLGRRFVGLEMEGIYVAQAGRRVGDILELRRQMEALTRCSPAEPA